MAIDLQKLNDLLDAQLGKETKESMEQYFFADQKSHKTSSRFEKALKSAEKKLMEATSKVSELTKYVKFKGFNDDEMDTPHFDWVHDDIFLIWEVGDESYEIDAFEVLNIINSKGFIEPSDF